MAVALGYFTLCIALFALGAKVSHRKPPAWASPTAYCVALFFWVLAFGEALGRPPLQSALVGLLLAVGGGVYFMYLAPATSAVSGVKDDVPATGPLRFPAAGVSETRTNETLLPDWPIRGLFFHLKPDLLNYRHDEAPWEAIGQTIRDRLALGVFNAWGRPDKKDLIDSLAQDGEMTVPEPIEPAYWRRATFTYWFLSQGKQYEVHTYPEPGSGLPAYRDLQVNRSQALSLVWPAIGVISIFLDEVSGGVRVALTQTLTNPPRDGPLSKWVQFTVKGAKPLVGCEARLLKVERIFHFGEKVIHSQQ